MRLESRLRAASLVSAMAAFTGWSPTARIIGKRMRPLTWKLPHQGAQEMARRRRQIDAGTLTYSNGVAR